MLFVGVGLGPWTWRGLVPTHADGQTYVIDIQAGNRIGDRIRIWCREPGLVPFADTGRPPHTFANGSLCVNDREPTSYEFIAGTTVPWTYSWLYFYERWVETGTWFGPEAPGHEIDRAATSAAAKEEPIVATSEQERDDSRHRGHGG